MGSKKAGRKISSPKYDLITIVISEMRSRVEAAISSIVEEENHIKGRIHSIEAGMEEEAASRLLAAREKIEAIAAEIGLEVGEVIVNELYWNYAGGPVYMGPPKEILFPNFHSYSKLPDQAKKIFGLEKRERELRGLRKDLETIRAKRDELREKLRSLDEKNIHIQAYVKRKELEETESGRELLSRVSDFADLYEKLGIDQSLLL